MRVAEHKTSLNRYRKEITKAAIKQATTAETLAKGYSAVDKAAKWGIIHPNKAARLKARLARSVKPAEEVVKAKPVKATAPKATKTVKPKTTRATAPKKKK